MAGKFIAPHVKGEGKSRFTCPAPDCQTLTSHEVFNFKNYDHEGYINRHMVTIDDRPYELLVSECSECSHEIIWTLLDLGDRKYSQIIAPNYTLIPPCSGDTPDLPRQLYLEAASIFGKSNRGCAALIRTALEILFQKIFESDQKLNAIIEANKEKIGGDYYEMAHAIRLVGNDGVHADVQHINLDEEADDVLEGLFLFFREIVKAYITDPAQRKKALQIVQSKSQKPMPAQESDDKNEGEAPTE